MNTRTRALIGTTVDAGQPLLYSKHDNYSKCCECVFIMLLIDKARVQRIPLSLSIDMIKIALRN